MQRAYTSAGRSGEGREVYQKRAQGAHGKQEQQAKEEWVGAGAGVAGVCSMGTAFHSWVVRWCNLVLAAKDKQLDGWAWQWVGHACHSARALVRGGRPGERAAGP